MTVSPGWTARRNVSSGSVSEGCASSGGTYKLLAPAISGEVGIRGEQRRARQLRLLRRFEDRPPQGPRVQRAS